MTPTPLGGAARAVASPPRAQPRISHPIRLKRTIRRLWWAAGILAVVAFLLRLAVRRWVQPAVVDWPDAAGLLAVLVTTLLAAGIPLVGYARLVRRHPRLPRTFVLAAGVTGDGRPSPGTGYGVPTSPWLAAYLIAAGALAAGLPPGGPDGRLSGVGPVAAGCAAVVLALSVWWRRRGPMLLLTTGGLVLRNRWRKGRDRHLSWALLWADQMPDPAPRARRLELPLRRLAPGAAPAGQPATAKLTWRWIDPEYLVATIRHYAEHAADRAAIGTPAGLDRWQASQRRLMSTPGADGGPGRRHVGPTLTVRPAAPGGSSTPGGSSVGSGSRSPVGPGGGSSVPAQRTADTTRQGSSDGRRGNSPGVAPRQ